jgi:apolipoprotein D and lipocalin family protein
MSSVLSLPQSLQPVPFEDLKKYAGKWFEIASIPQGFKKGCDFTTAEYSLNDQFYVKGTKGLVKNHPLSIGEKKSKAQFFWPFKGKYWVIELADDFSYAVLGHPTRNHLWILSRFPSMAEITLKKIILKINHKGYDTSSIKPINNPHERHALLRS